MYAKVTAQASWLPAVKDVNKNIRLLECSYNEAELKHCEEINSSSNWEVRTEQAMANGGKLYIFSFTASTGYEGCRCGSGIRPVWLDKR